MPDIDRLRSYYPFEEDVLDAVNRAAVVQNGRSTSELGDLYGISDGFEYPSDGHKPIEVLTIRPKSDYNEQHARVMHAPMAMTAESMALRAMRLFESDPTSQLVVLGNPAALGTKYGKLSVPGALSVWHGNLAPIVRPYLMHLESNGITSTEETGYSWGADKSAAGTSLAIEHGISVERAVWTEAVSLEKCHMWTLLKDFMSAGGELNNYINAYGGESLPAPSDSLQSLSNFLRWAGGFLRASNIAIETVLKKDGYEGRVGAALDSQQSLGAVIAHGTSSEIVALGETHQMVERIKSKGPGLSSRIGEMALVGMHHAGGDDIDLHAAIVLQGLRMPIGSA